MLRARWRIRTTAIQATTAIASRIAIRRCEIGRRRDLDVLARVFDQRDGQAGPLCNRRIVRKIVTAFGSGGTMRFQDQRKLEALRRLRAP